MNQALGFQNGQRLMNQALGVVVDLKTKPSLAEESSNLIAPQREALTVPI